MNNEEKANLALVLNRKSKQDRKMKEALKCKQSDGYENNKQLGNEFNNL